MLLVDKDITGEDQKRVAKQTLTTFKCVKKTLAENNDTNTIQQVDIKIIKQTLYDHEKYAQYIYAAICIRQTHTPYIQKQLEKTLNNQSYPQLKKYRKYGMRLKNIVRFLNEKEVSEEFSTLIRDFGKLKDYLAIQDISIEKKEELLVDFRKKFENHHNQADIKINTVNKKGLKERLDRRIQRIKEINKDTTVNIESYHDMRKYLRDVMLFFRFAAATQEKESKDIKNEIIICHYLQNIVDKMEIMHDNIIQLTIKTNTQDAFDKYHVPINTEIKKQIQVFVDRYEEI